MTSIDYRKQRTIKREAIYSGIGIHTGKIVNLRLCPAKEGTGVVFKRVDVMGTPIIPATVEYVCDTRRSTSIGVGDVVIHTVEHVLAAIRAFGIDNVIIEVDGIEPPVGNGSSDVFVELIEEAGTEDQDAKIPVIKLEEPVYYSEGDISIVAIPDDCYRISYTLNYPESRILRSQFHTVVINKDNFKKEIAPCRTFSQYEEIAPLIERGLIKGGSLDNAVIIKDDAVFSKNGLYFPDEMVRHKILDMVGDLSLVGFDFHAHVIALRSGHHTNVAFAKKILNVLSAEKTHEFQSV